MTGRSAVVAQAPLTRALLFRVLWCAQLFHMWRGLGLSHDGLSKRPRTVTDPRLGLPALPNCWCPPRPRAPARSPGRVELRAYLGLLMEVRRMHANELVQGYAHWARVHEQKAPSEPLQPGEPLLRQHALYVLRALKYERRANARWEIMIEWQLAPESEEACDAAAVAAELRGAAAKIGALEDLLVEGLAEYSDARGALRMHMFNQDADIPLQVQLANRLAGTALGELLGQRFEQLELPDFAPRQLGAAQLMPGGGGGPAADGEGALPFVIPASEAAEELAIDNSLLALWLGVLPALLRNATGCTGGGAVVGDPEAYDAALTDLLRGFVDDPSTQIELTLVAIARYSWGCLRKGPEPCGPDSGAAPPAGLKPAQLKEIKKFYMPLRARVAAATPKGGSPFDPATKSALKDELGTLEKDALDAKDPNEQGVEEMRNAVNALLDLLSVGVRAMRHQSERAAGAGNTVAEGATSAEALALEESRRAATVRAIKKVRDDVSDALMMSLDVNIASRLDAEQLLSCAGEAVCDVSVEQSDLIRGVYKLLYRSKLDAVLTSPKIPNGASRQFLNRLIKRKPVVRVRTAADLSTPQGPRPADGGSRTRSQHSARWRLHAVARALAVRAWPCRALRTTARERARASSHR